MWTRKIFLLLLTKRIGTCPTTKATEVKSALSQGQMDQSWPTNTLKGAARSVALGWQRAGTLFSMKQSLMQSLKGLYMVIICKDRQLVSGAPKTPTSTPKSHCAFCTSPLPASHVSMDPAAPRFRSKGQRRKTKLEAINEAPYIFILLHG